MRIIKSSTAFKILYYLYFYGEAEYKHLSTVISECSDETIKDSMQKLVRAEYVLKVNGTKKSFFAITHRGIKALSKKTGAKLNLKQPCKDKALLKTKSKENYEKYLFDILSHTINNARNFDKRINGISILNFKDYKRSLSTDELDKVRASSCSFALVNYPISNYKGDIIIFPIYLLDSYSSAVQDTIERNANTMMEKIVKNKTYYNGQNIIVKCIFILNNLKDFYEIMQYNEKIEKYKKRKCYRNKNRTYGKLIATSIIGDKNNLFLLLNEKNIDNLIYNILNIVIDRFNRAKVFRSLKEKYNIEGNDSLYSINLIGCSFRCYYDAYLTVSKNNFYLFGTVESRSIPIVINKWQSDFLTMINDIERITRREEIKNNMYYCKDISLDFPVIKPL